MQENKSVFFYLNTVYRIWMVGNLVQSALVYLPPTKEEVNVFVRAVCLLARLQKTRAWIWMKCCMSTECRDMDELIHF